MQYRMCLMMLGILSALSACGKKDTSEENKITERVPYSNFQGTWGDCDSLFNQYFEFSLEQDQYTARVIRYNGDACAAGTETIEWRITGTLNEDAEAALPSSDIPLIPINVNIDNFEVTFFNQDAALEGNGIKRFADADPVAICEDVFFPIGERISLIDESCLTSFDEETYEVKKARPFKDLLGMKDDGLFYSTRLFASPLFTQDEFESPDERPDLIPDIHLTRQDETKSIAVDEKLTSLGALKDHLVGTWELCSKTLSTKMTIVFDGQSYTQTIDSYNELACDDTDDPANRYVQQVFTGTYSINKFSSASPGGFEIDWHLVNNTVQPLDADTTDYLNATGAYAGETPYCNDQTFVLNQTQSLLNKHCDVGGEGYELVGPSTLYDMLFYHAGSGLLYDSLPEDPNNGASAETRIQRTAWGLNYVKQ